jgi:serine/threonine protein kinase
MFPVEDYKFDLSEPLDKIYKFVKVIGHGGDGVVLHIVNRVTELDIALKIVPKCKSNPIEIEKNVASKSNLFSRCYGMIVATELPNEWTQQIIKESDRVSFDKNIFFGYFYEYSGTSLHTWMNTKTNEKTRRLVLGIVFEVFYAILWAGKTARFTHGDLHPDNVLLKPYKTERRYVINDKSFVIDTPLIIQIIDFDRSSVGHLGDGDVCLLMSRDLLTFIELFKDTLRFGTTIPFGKISDDINKLLKKAKKQNSYENIEKVFDLQYFDQFVAPPAESYIKRSKIECHICGDRATRKLENRPSLAFCADDNCVLKLGHIAHMI